jgi:hypothetical protein
LGCLRSGEPLSAYDAWGAPWEQVLILIARRPLLPGERLGLVLTEGSAFNLKLNGISGGLRQLTGAKPGFGGGKCCRHDLIERALAESVRRLNAKILRRWEAEGRTGANMRYIGLVLDAAATDLTTLGP